MVKRVRFYDMDLYRFVAAVIVVMFHYTFRGFAADDLSTIEFPYLAQVFKYGYLGVDLFFMISGFVILLTACNKNIIDFTISRMVRLYPAFWVSVTFTALAAWFFGSEKFAVEPMQYIANLSMVSGYFGIKYVDGVYWTLLVEIRFYLLVGLFLLFGKIQYFKYFLILWSLVAWVNLHVNISGQVAFLLLLDWASYFIAGATFYLIKVEGGHLWKTVMVISAYLLSLQYAWLRIPFLEVHYSSGFSEVIIGVIITVFYLCMAATAYGKTDMINRKEMLVLGVLTYPLYLIHQNIGYMIMGSLGMCFNKYFLLLLTVSSMLLAAFFISKYIERRGAKLFKQILMKGTSVLPLSWRNG